MTIKFENMLEAMEMACFYADKLIKKAEVLFVRFITLRSGIPEPVDVIEFKIRNSQCSWAYFGISQLTEGYGLWLINESKFYGRTCQRV